MGLFAPYSLLAMITILFRSLLFFFFNQFGVGRGRGGGVVNGENVNIFKTYS